MFANVVLLLGNAFIYGYWFMINRVVMNQHRSQILTAALQPVLNILIYIPSGTFIFALMLPLQTVLLKLWAGMVVFMLCGYAILYVMDRPSKREFNFSGVDLMSAMINQWLYDIVKDHDILNESGVERDVPVHMLTLRGANGGKTVMVKPDIHYGPLVGVGGSGTTEHLGAQLSSAGATPFVMHGAVNIEDNPVSHTQVTQLSSAVVDRLQKLRGSSFDDAKGNISVGTAGSCRAIAIKINDLCILTLSKAPLITEDIDREVGVGFTSLVKKYVPNVILLDAHNSRIESASKEELKGVYPGSRYVGLYEQAIKNAMAGLSRSTPVTLNFGSCSSRPNTKLHHKDIGNGFLSVGIFSFGKSRFCMVYFDANNMLPGFRAAVLSHIKKKFKLDAEVYTTDTHAVNSLSMSVSNVLGRVTAVEEIIPELDALISKSLAGMSKTQVSYSEFLMERFRIWGGGSEDKLMKVSRDVIHLGKRRLPILIATFFIIAIWAIYVV